jgi:hypothetical protein
MSDYSCYHCGKEGYKSGNYDPTPKGWVYNKSFGFGAKLFCSNKCLNEFNSQNSEKSNNSSEDNYTSKSNNNNSGPGFMEKMAAADIKQAEADRLREEQEYLMKERQDSKIKDIASIQFGTSKEEITNIIEQLIVQGSNISSPKERKAISDKLELGINKLKQQGVDCSYYEEKNRKIKPTVWQKIAYYFANN